MRSTIIKRKEYRRVVSFILVLALAVGSFCFSGETAEAKGSLSPGDCVKNVLVYAVNSQGQQVLVSQLNVSDMLDYLNDNFESYGKVHNYSILDRLVTPVHQEAQGLTVDEMVDYAESESTLQDLDLTFSGDDSIAVWEIDGAAFDVSDTYTYNALYGVDRYNFPALYGQWNYDTQQYKDIDAIWASRLPEMPLLSITAFSQRYGLTTEKVNNGDYNMEGYFDSSGLLDTAKTVRLMLPMTESDFRNKVPTADKSRYGICYMLLDMSDAPVIEAGAVAAPTCEVIDGDASTEDSYDAGYCYFTLDCATEGASIYYNDSSVSSYMPTALYTEGQEIKVRKALGVAVLNVRAVKDGCVDAGVKKLTSASGGDYEEYVDPEADVWDGVSVEAAPGEYEDGVYVIEVDTCAKLKWVADQVNSGSASFAGVTIRLGNNLHLNNKEWQVIGENKGIEYGEYGDHYTDDSWSFQGTFDGCGYTISGLNPFSICDEKYSTKGGANGVYGRIGLFGMVSGAVVKNLTVSGVIASTDNYAGGIAGEARSSTFENCVNRTRITSDPENVLLTGYRGGIAGAATGSTFTDCVNYGDISANSSSSHGIGGVAGSMNGGTITGCRNYGGISSSTGRNCWGIGGNASYCTNYGAVDGSGVGANASYCVNFGDVTGDGVGVNASYCVNFGDVTGNGVGNGASRCINNGTVIGNGISGNGSADACVNTGSVTTGLMEGGDPDPGDFVVTYSALSNSYNMGTASRAGLTGVAGASASNCYNGVSGAALGGYTYGATTLKNIYYLQGGTEVAGDAGRNLLDVIPKTETEMKSDSFVALLNANAGQTLFTADTAGLNGGFPKFTWETGIIFDTNGGSSIASQHMLPGTASVAPAAPVRSGYTFTGWFADEALTSSYDFDSPVGSEITLYAGWQERETVTPVDKEVLLSWTGDPKTTQTVTWHDDSAAGYAQYVREDNYINEGSFSAAGQITATSSSVGYTSPKKYWQATITSLAPDTKYYYRVGSSEDWSGVYTFTTAKAGNKNFSFMYLGDVQYITTAEAEYPVWGTLLNDAYEKNPDIAFGLLGGDMVEGGSNMNDWTHFLSYASGVFSKIPMMTANGNHESNFTGGKPQFYTAILGLPENGPDGFKEEFYSFNYGTVHVTVLNSWALSSEQNLSAGTLQAINKWIADDLASAGNAKFRVVVMHHPAYALQSDVVSSAVRSQWTPLFEAGGVDLVFCGHQHMYARSYPLKTGTVDYGSGVTYVMGNSGQKFYTEANEAYQAKVIRNKSTYQIVDINGDTLSLYTYDSDGRLLDSWSADSRVASLTGDVDGDNDVDMDDVGAVFHAYLTNDDSNDMMDVNGDSAVDIRDAQLVLNIVLGKAS
jgi:uncharacterized repeat protein (TIGR02543 family)